MGKFYLVNLEKFEGKAKQKKNREMGVSPLPTYLTHFTHYALYHFTHYARNNVQLQSPYSNCLSSLLLFTVFSTPNYPLWLSYNCPMPYFFCWINKLQCISGINCLQSWKPHVWLGRVKRLIHSFMGQVVCPVIDVENKEGDGVGDLGIQFHGVCHPDLVPGVLLLERWSQATPTVTTTDSCHTFICSVWTIGAQINCRNCLVTVP